MSWTTAPTENELNPGTGWDTTSEIPQEVLSQGWFIFLLERVAPFNGSGNLTAVMNPKFPQVAVAFNGDGEFLPAITLKNYRFVNFSDSGSLIADIFILVDDVSVDFSGSGILESVLNDGLSAIIQAGIAGPFGGGGGLEGAIVGGIHYEDGLTAFVWERYLTAAGLSGSGSLVALFDEVKIALANFNGAGALTSSVNQVYSLMADLAGSGQLSASAYAVFLRTADLIGDGQLSATAFASFLRSIGFDGAGTLTSLFWPFFQQSSSQGGVGTLSAPIYQKYSLAPALNGSGSLSATVSQIYPVTAPFSGDGTITFLPDGLSATVVKV